MFVFLTRQPKVYALTKHSNLHVCTKVSFLRDLGM